MARFPGAVDERLDLGPEQFPPVPLSLREFREGCFSPASTPENENPVRRSSLGIDQGTDRLNGPAGRPDLLKDGLDIPTTDAD